MRAQSTVSSVGGVVWNGNCREVRRSVVQIWLTGGASCRKAVGTVEFTIARQMATPESLLKQYPVAGDRTGAGSRLWATADRGRRRRLSQALGAMRSDASGSAQ